jgi:hypothetical protein
MRRHLAAASAITAAVTVLANCTPHSGFEPAPAGTRPATTTLRVEGDDLAASPSTSTRPGGPAAVVYGAAATAAPITIVMAVPPLPADLSPLRPTGTTATEDGHDHDSEGPATAADVAVAWIVAIYTARFDDPAGLAADQLAALAATEDVAAAAVASIEPIDIERSEARWPIVTTVTEAGAGTWRVEFVVKRTLAGQVGPSTSGPLAVDVTVTAGHVTAWRLVAAP